VAAAESVQAPATAFDEEMHGDQGETPDPATLLMQKADRQLIQRALAEVPRKFREMLVLRELEGLSHEEIAEVADVLIGTVMSSLARARGRLRQSVTCLLNQGSSRSSAQGTLASRGRPRCGESFGSPARCALEQRSPQLLPSGANPAV
jgi:RNA polymerase sigma-70 factor (ECF subfamily)